MGEATTAEEVVAGVAAGEAAVVAAGTGAGASGRVTLTGKAGLPPAYRCGGANCTPGPGPGPVRGSCGACDSGGSIGVKTEPDAGDGGGSVSGAETAGAVVAVVVVVIFVVVSRVAARNRAVKWSICRWKISSSLADAWPEATVSMSSFNFGSMVDLAASIRMTGSVLVPVCRLGALAAATPTPPPPLLLLPPTGRFAVTVGGLGMGA